MKKYSIVVVIFALIMILGETSINLFEKNNYEKMREELIVHGNDISKNIQKEVNVSISAVTLNELFLKNYKYDTANFNEWSKLILSNYESILNVQLAPNGVIKYIYPLKGNEKAIGIDLLNDEKRKKAATKEFLTGKVSFIGPVNLIQNNKLAFIARKPIEQNKNGINEFWVFLQ